MKVEQPYQA